MGIDAGEWLSSFPWLFVDAQCTFPMVARKLVQITHAPPGWSAGQKYAVQGVESGKALQPRRPRGGWGTTSAFNRAGMRIQNLNV